MDDTRALTELTKKINDAENDGNQDFLSSILAPKLAFQRADAQKTVDDRVAFLQKVKPRVPPALVEIIEPIQMYGNRAVVQSIVKVGDQDFHNLRLFIRRDGEWKLLGWANEPV
jgi:hypothetical protein